MPGELDDGASPLLVNDGDGFHEGDRESQFDLHQVQVHQVPQVKGTTWISAVFLVVNAALGAGLLNFPQAYDRAGGIVVAVIVQAVLIVFVVIALLVLAACADLNDSGTYQDVVFTFCGKRGQQLCAVGIVLYCYGTCITFLIIIGDQFDRIFASLHGPDFCHFWYFDRNILVAVSSTLLILPLCFPRRIDFLKYASSLGVLAIIYVVFLIIYEYYAEDYHKGVVKTRPDSWTDVFNVVPVICFGYQCHVSVVPIYACLRERTVIVFSKTVIAAIVICVATYTAAGIFGYLTFGSQVPSDILEAYDAKQAIVLVGIVALAIKTYTTYPVLQFCGRAAIESLISEAANTSRFTFLQKERNRRICISLIWFATSVALSIIVPNIGSIIELLGSLAAVFIFVFPGACWMQSTYLKDPFLVLRKDRLIIIASFCLMVVGMFIFGVVFTQAIQSNLNEATSDISLCTA